MKKANLLLLLATSLVLQACTVAYYNLNNKLADPSPLYERGENVAYHLSVNAKPEQLTRDAHYTPSQIQQMMRRYSESTKKVFGQEGVIATEVETPDDASFLINISSTPFFSALPQEWLTGLSFGLIPSWGTRHNEYSYAFEAVGVKSVHTYTVDSKSFNHLVCLPFFWTMFFTLDEPKVYEEALRNYLIKGTGANGHR